MTDALRRAAAPLGLLIVLVVAIALPIGDELDLAQPDSEAAEGFADLVATIPADSSVLLGFDPDIGTYAEVRPTVRAVIAALAERGVGFVLVSLTPEGRALAVEERASLVEGGADGSSLVDLGFIPGSEAALVRIANALSGSSALGTSARAELAGVDVVLVVGGNDIGPRSWVEQVAPRVESIRLAAISPTILLPEVAPYAETGQLVATISNPRDGAALRELLDATTGRADDDDGPPVGAVLVGLAVAIAFLGEGLVRWSLRTARPRPEREAAG